TWSIVPSPNSGADANELNAVAVVGPNDVWAVGSWSIGSVKQTLTEHWNGTAWSIVPSPNLEDWDNVLYAIAVVSPGEVWTVGYYSDSLTFIEQTLVERWNGTSWNVVSSPNGSGGYNHLRGVDVAGPNDIWAVGD